MKMVKVYQSKGWDVKKAVKPKVQAEKVEESE